MGLHRLHWQRDWDWNDDLLLLHQRQQWQDLLELLNHLLLAHGLRFLHLANEDQVEHHEGEDKEAFCASACCECRHCVSLFVCLVDSTELLLPRLFLLLLL